mmetsp:Transcript_14615/g.21552  ORF Transcript_14615/g.21552 Transcript_14615/m.21552 type:complete len:870 (+) Transcript_14615:51-2660(+)
MLILGRSRLVYLLLLVVLRASDAVKTLVNFVESLERRGTLTSTQTDVIVQNLKGDELPMMMMMMMHHNNKLVLSLEQEDLLNEYFQQEEVNGRMTTDVRNYLSTLFRFRKPDNTNQIRLRMGTFQQKSHTQEFSVPSSYDNESSTGVVELLGHYRPHDYVDDPEFPYYRGIWGFAVGEEEEYALLTDIHGLHIVNVTDAALPTLVKFIQLENLEYAKSVRDVDVHIDDTTNTVYAYVAAQNYDAVGHLHVVNVTGILLLGQDNDDDVDKYVVDRGALEYGHTVTVSNGILVLNTGDFAEEPDVFGCQLFDLNTDPWNPTIVGVYTGGECHDTTLHLLRVNNDDDENRLVMISADGNNREWRFVDVRALIQDYQIWKQFWATGKIDDNNNITTRSSGKNPFLPPGWEAGSNDGGGNSNYESPTNLILGKTKSIPGFDDYAHSHVLDEDTMLLYVFEEQNEYDVAIWNVTTLNNPVLMKLLTQDSTREGAVVHNGHLLKKSATGATYLAIAYYRAGLRVWDVTNVDNIQEVGHFDTFQNLDGDSNNIDPNELFDDDQFDSCGAWNLYTGLPSGNVLVSDLQQGLYILNVITADDEEDEEDDEAGDLAAIKDVFDTLVLPDFGPYCISGAMTVTLSNGEPKQVQDLKVGDMVLVSENENVTAFEPIVMFGHYDPDIMATYHHLTLNDGSTVEISEHHLIYTARQHPPVPASTLQIGQQLQCGRRITQRAIRRRKGAYAPWTRSGMLMIQDQVLISAYVTLQPNETHVSLLGWNWSYHFLAHSMTLPVRLSFFWKRNNDDDVAWLYDWVQRYWVQQSPCILALMLVVIIIPLALLFHFVEQAMIMLPESMIILILLVAAATSILAKKCRINIT